MARTGRAELYVEGDERVDSDGYVIVKVRSHRLYPNRNNRKSRWIRRSRLIISEELGRPLDRDEIVHHRNGNKTDDRRENLELLSLSDHSSHHTSEQWTERREEMEGYAAKGRASMQPMTEERKKFHGDHLRKHISEQSSEEMSRRAQCRDRIELSDAMVERWKNPEYRAMMVERNGRRKR